MDRRKFIGGVVTNLLAAPLAALGAPPPATRRAIKATALVALTPNTVTDLGPYANPSVAGGNSITDYSGITYDPIGKRMLLFGGGHGPANETDIRAFDLTTLAWSSLYPSMPYSDMTLANCDSDLGRWTSTNHPFARHSYNATLVAGRRFYMMCFQGMPYINGIAESQWGGRICWYDLDAGTWAYSQIPRGQTPWQFTSAAALDPTSGKILVVGPDVSYQSSIWFYDPATDTISAGPKWSPPVGGSLDLVYVPDNRNFYAISQLDGKVWEIVPNRTNLNLSTVTFVAVSANLPSYTGSPPSGYAYDPINRIIGGFVMNGVFSAFDPFARTWRRSRMTEATTGNAADHVQRFYCLDFDPDSGCFIFLGDGGGLKARTFAYRYRDSSSGHANYEGLWWNAPAGSESGWGINLTHQGDVIFATWFTYDLMGKAWWLSMTATHSADNTYTGTLYETRGPAFYSIPFDPTLITTTAVGSGTLTFSDPSSGTFAYTINSSSQVKTITREIFANPAPSCIFDTTEDSALASNYQDLWWSYPPGSESGWGINLVHQGEVIFATWFTYDDDGNPLWLSAATTRLANGVYTGTLNQTTGPAFNAVRFDPADITVQPVGSATFAFSDGANGSFDYTFGKVTQTKRITRMVFRTPVTVCA